MNCLEFRRTILIDPNDVATSLDEHAQTCTACAAFKNDQLAFEQQLNDTLEVDIPDGLASRILLAQSTGTVQIQKRQRRIYAVAASFILAVGVLMGVQLTSQVQSVDQMVLAHVRDEANHLQDKFNVNDKSIQLVFRQLNMSVSESLGAVNYASKCDIRKEDGAHLVLQGKNGPVTVLIMPTENVVARQVISDQRFHGVIIPAQRGSFAIVGEHGESLEPYVKQFGRVIKM